MNQTGLRPIQKKAFKVLGRLIFLMLIVLPGAFTPMVITQAQTEGQLLMDVTEEGTPEQSTFTDETVGPLDTSLVEPVPIEPVDETMPRFIYTSDYRYEPVGKRDPFRPFRDSKIGVGLIRQQQRPLEPLEKFDVKVLEVVAILWGTDKPKALIRDPERHVHSIVKGQRIGRNEGYVAEIREGEVVIVELYDLNGKIVKEPYVLCIDKNNKGKGCGAS